MPSVKKNGVFLNGRNANYFTGIAKTEDDKTIACKQFWQIQFL